MTTDEIKAEMEARHMSITELARKLDITADGLGRILAGKRPMTGQLSRHISLLLEKERDVVITYRVNLPESRVEELCCDCHTEAERRAAISSLLHHNMAVLAALGATLNWTPEERQLLGLDTPSNSYHHEG